MRAMARARFLRCSRLGGREWYFVLCEVFYLVAREDSGSADMGGRYWVFLWQ